MASYRVDEGKTVLAPERLRDQQLGRSDIEEVSCQILANCRPVGGFHFDEDDGSAFLRYRFRIGEIDVGIEPDRIEGRPRQRLTAHGKADEQCPPFGRGGNTVASVAVTKGLLG